MYDVRKSHSPIYISNHLSVRKKKNANKKKKKKKKKKCKH